MKKILASILAFAVSSTILCSCSEAEDDDRDEFRSENESKIEGIIGDEEDDEEKGVGVEPSPIGNNKKLCNTESFSALRISFGL